MKCHFDIDFKRRTISLEKFAKAFYCIEKKGLVKIIKIQSSSELSFLDEWIPVGGAYFLN